MYFLLYLINLRKNIQKHMRGYTELLTVLSHLIILEALKHIKISLVNAFKPVFQKI